jgi:pyruvate/2-oxoglutarate dehydrogenase complex dihydrolipoamide acyltransferase (E2) component
VSRLHEIRIPKLGMDTTEAEVKAWLVAVGDRVTPGAPLLEVETEKASVVLEAEIAGVVREVHVAVGDVVPIGSVVGLIDDGI